MSSAEDEMAKLDQEIGARLRFARKSRGMTQSALGAALGVSFQQLQKYERGANRLSASSLILVSQALGVTPRELLEVDAPGGKLDDVAAITLEGAEGLLRAYKYMSGARRGLLREIARGLAQVDQLEERGSQPPSASAPITRST